MTTGGTQIPPALHPNPPVFWMAIPIGSTNFLNDRPNWVDHLFECKTQLGRPNFWMENPKSKWVDWNCVFCFERTLVQGSRWSNWQIHTCIFFPLHTPYFSDLGVFFWGGVLVFFGTFLCTFFWHIFWGTFLGGYLFWHFFGNLFLTLFSHTLFLAHLFSSLNFPPPLTLSARLLSGFGSENCFKWIDLSNSGLWPKNKMGRLTGILKWVD